MMLISLAAALYIIVLIVQNRTAGQAGSDHYYHMSLIQAIRDNKHRFVRSHPQMIGEKYFDYPQLYHWMLSFLKPAVLQRYYWLSGIFLDMAGVTAFLTFAYIIHPFLKTDIDLEQFMVISGLIFIFTPFTYAIWNAKNTGISARGFGLLIGQIYVYLICLYLLFGNILFLLSSFFVAFVILLSSQFAFQFALFSAPLFSLFFKNAVFLLIPFLAFAIFYCVMPVLAKDYVRTQFFHKLIYYKYLAKVFILRSRYSIWRDFVWDFWARAGSTDFRKLLVYIYYNPLMSLIVGMPFFTSFAAYFCIDSTVRSLVLMNKGLQNVAIPVIVSLLIFVLTSFRRTRFLGEPERYMEFCIPQIAVLGATIFFMSPSLLSAVLGFAVMLVIVQLIMKHLRNKYGTNRYSKTEKTFEKIVEILDRANSANGSKERIFSNDGEMNKKLLASKWKVLDISLTTLRTGQFHIEDIFPVEFPHIANSVLLPLIKEFKINWFVLNTSILPNYILENSDIFLEEIETVEHFKLFRVCSKN